MTNDRDQALLRSAVSIPPTNLLAFLPSLGTREVLAFGEGVALPTRLKFKQLPAQLLPKSESAERGEEFVAGISQDFIASVLERWRGATTNQRNVADEAPLDARPRVRPGAPRCSRRSLSPAPSAPALEPNRFRLLKKSASDLFGSVQTPGQPGKSRTGAGGSALYPRAHVCTLSEN